LPMSMLFLFGRMLSRHGKRVHRHALILFVAMFFIFIAILTLTMWSEYRGNPILANLGIYGPNMEGKEVRFGAGLSALFTVITTAFTTGSVNN
ncbi:potassium-transporting ATPase subunit KdpA, partial [Escherichia coli]|nr:potassium-transporting ATPase subunit KdpA [Escherichia coli]